MTNDTKYSGTMSSESRFAGSIINDIKNKAIFLATQALDFLMTEANDFIVTSKSGEMTNDTKY